MVTFFLKCDGEIYVSTGLGHDPRINWDITLDFSKKVLGEINISESGICMKHIISYKKGGVIPIIWRTG